jgi:hypothetical protein
MITIDDLADLEQTRAANPTATICFVEQDGTKLMFRPGRDDEPVRVPPERQYVPRYTNK